MKIKHWQGYGLVNATKVSKIKNESETVLTIKVKGNHEWGLERDDKYDLYNWLVKRFDKSVENYRQIKHFEGFPVNEADIDTYIYKFYY